MRPCLPGGAGSSVAPLVDGFADDPATNFAPINLGQLKAVSKPFYDQHLDAGVVARGAKRGQFSEWLV